MIKAFVIFCLLAFSSFTQIEIRKSLQEELIESFSKSPLNVIQSDSSGVINNVIVREVPRFLQTFIEFTRIPVSLFHIVSYFALAVLVDTVTSLILILTGGLVFLVLKPILAVSRKISVDVSSQAATLQEVIIECVQNNYYFKATERAEPILRRIKNGINNLGKLDFRLSFLATFSKSVGEPVSVTFMALVIYFFVYVEGQTLDQVLVISFLFYRLMMRIINLQGQMQRFNGSIGGLITVEHHLQKMAPSEVLQGVVHVKELNKEICFNSVQLMVSNKQILNNVTVSIRPNAFIGIAGIRVLGKPVSSI